MAGCSFPLLALAAQSGRLAKQCWATLYLVAFLHQVCRAPVPLDEYTVINRTAPNVTFADSQGIKYIAGDYWDVWPTVFQLLNRGKPSFGLAARGEGNLHHLIASINEDLKQDIIPKALCVSETYEICARWASHITGYTWVPPKLPCPELSCRIITMKVKDEIPNDAIIGDWDVRIGLHADDRHCCRLNNRNPLSAVVIGCGCESRTSPPLHRDGRVWRVRWITKTQCSPDRHLQWQHSRVRRMRHSDRAAMLRRTHASVRSRRYLRLW